MEQLFLPCAPVGYSGEEVETSFLILFPPFGSQSKDTCEHLLPSSQGLESKLGQGSKGELYFPMQLDKGGDTLILPEGHHAVQRVSTKPICHLRLVSSTWILGNKWIGEYNCSSWRPYYNSDSSPGRGKNHVAFSDIQYNTWDSGSSVRVFKFQTIAQALKSTTVAGLSIAWASLNCRRLRSHFSSHLQSLIDVSDKLPLALVDYIWGCIELCKIPAVLC